MKKSHAELTLVFVFLHQVEGGSVNLSFQQFCLGYVARHLVPQEASEQELHELSWIKKNPQNTDNETVPNG